jgi:hypothetical protein
MELDIQKLSKEVAAVATVGFGRDLRKNADTDQLLIVAQWLVNEKHVNKFRLFEDAIRPSVERMGDGAIGQLARIEFRLAPEAQNLYYLKERQAQATRQLGIRGEALKRLEEEMCLAIAKDLALRLDTVLPEAMEAEPVEEETKEPPPLPPPALYPGFKTVDELTEHLEKNGEEIY